MSSGKKAQKSFDAKSLSRKEQLWLPATPEKATFYTHFYQPRFEIILMLSFTFFWLTSPGVGVTSWLLKQTVIQISPPKN